MSEENNQSHSAGGAPSYNAESDRGETTNNSHNSGDTKGFSAFHEERANAGETVSEDSDLSVTRATAEARETDIRNVAESQVLSTKAHKSQDDTSRESHEVHNVMPARTVPIPSRDEQHRSIYNPRSGDRSPFQEDRSFGATASGNEEASSVKATDQESTPFQLGDGDVMLDVEAVDGFPRAEVAKRADSPRAIEALPQPEFDMRKEPLLDPEIDVRNVPSTSKVYDPTAALAVEKSELPETSRHEASVAPREDQPERNIEIPKREEAGEQEGQFEGNDLEQTPSIQDENLPSVSDPQLENHSVRDPSEKVESGMQISNLDGLQETFHKGSPSSDTDGSESLESQEDDRSFVPVAGLDETEDQNTRPEEYNPGSNQIASLLQPSEVGSVVGNNRLELPTATEALQQDYDLANRPIENESNAIGLETAIDNEITEDTTENDPRCSEGEDTEPSSLIETSDSDESDEENDNGDGPHQPSLLDFHSQDGESGDERDLYGPGAQDPRMPVNQPHQVSMSTVADNLSNVANRISILPGAQHIYSRYLFGPPETITYKNSPWLFCYHLYSRGYRTTILPRPGAMYRRLLQPTSRGACSQSQLPLPTQWHRMNRNRLHTEKRDAIPPDGCNVMHFPNPNEETPGLTGNNLQDTGSLVFYAFGQWLTMLPPEADMLPSAPVNPVPIRAQEFCVQCGEDVGNGHNCLENQINTRAFVDNAGQEIPENVRAFNDDPNM